MNHFNIKITQTKALLFFAIILIVLFATMEAESALKSQLNRNANIKNYVEGEIIIKFKKGVTPMTIRNSVNRLGNKKIRNIGDPGLLHVRVEKGKSVEDAISAYKNNPDVEYAQPNYIYRALQTEPDDTYYNRLWGMKNRGQEVPVLPNSSYPQDDRVSGCDMDMELAWDQITDCSSVVVAVIDTGVNYNHEDLKDNIWKDGYGNHGRDFVDNDDDPMDLNGHGTTVAGTIGAIGNNNVGTTGVCWSAKIMAVRVLNTTGGGTTETVMRGVAYAVYNGANVINLSLGGSIEDAAFSESIRAARNHDIVVVAAAGNNEDGCDVDCDCPCYPCKYSHDNIICVAALDQANELAGFSNYGSISVDVGSPGVNIWSLWPVEKLVTEDDFSEGWIEYPSNSEWERGEKELSSGTYRMIYNPSAWPNGEYSNDCNDKIYKSFNIDNNADAVMLSFYAFIDVELNYDNFQINYSNINKNPFISGIALDQISGTTEDYAYLFKYEMPECAGHDACTVGFQLETDSMYGDKGIGVLLFEINSLNLSNSQYNIVSGTSIAAPHVTGLAAMILAYNPDYTYMDVINSIYNGAKHVEALSAITTTGKAVNAWGALRYLYPPTGVEVVLLIDE